jgi:hypothetical protein
MSTLLTVELIHLHVHSPYCWRKEIHPHIHTVNGGNEYTLNSPLLVVETYITSAFSSVGIRVRPALTFQHQGQPGNTGHWLVGYCSAIENYPFTKSTWTAVILLIFSERLGLFCSRIEIIEIPRLKNLMCALKGQSHEMDLAFDVMQVSVRPK